MFSFALSQSQIQILRFSDYVNEAFQMLMEICKANAKVISMNTYQNNL